MFNPKEPIEATQEEIDEIIKIKEFIASEVGKWKVKDREQLFLDLLWKNIKLAKVKNIIPITKKPNDIRW